MGIVIAGIRLIKQHYDFVLRMAEKVDTRTLQREMENFVYESFSTFKPLRRKFKEICTVTEKTRYYTSTYNLCIGEWIRRKSRYHQYGSIVDHSESFLKIIREHGDELKPHVRKSIKEDFAKAVDLTKQLIMYRDFEVSVCIRPREVYTYLYLYCRGGKSGIEIKPVKIERLTIKTQSPTRIFYGKDTSIQLEDESNVSIVEDLIDDLVDLFRKADAEVCKVREHNERVMKQIEDVVAPYKIVNHLR